MWLYDQTAGGDIILGSVHIFSFNSKKNSFLKFKTIYIPGQLSKAILMLLIFLKLKGHDNSTIQVRLNNLFPHLQGSIQ